MSEKETSEKQGGFLSGLKGLLFEEDGPKGPEKSGGEPVKSAKSTAPPRPAPAPSRPSAPKVSDPRIREMLERDVHLAAQPAYSEFVKIEEGLRPIIPDEGTRIRAALASLTASKDNEYDFEAVIFDVNECLEALDKKEAEAQAAAEEAVTKRVGQRERKVEDLGQQIQAKRTEMEGLERAIAKLEVERDREQQAISQDRHEIETTHARFADEVKLYRSELETALRNLNRHGKDK